MVPVGPVTVNIDWNNGATTEPPPRVAGPYVVTADDIAPDGPVGPVLPVAPVGPVLPVAPVGPVFPVAPVGPVLPVAPVGPVLPVAPVGPVFPVAPVGPVLPVAPVGPVDPVAPGMIGMGKQELKIVPAGTVTLPGRIVPAHNGKGWANTEPEAIPKPDTTTVPMGRTMSSSKGNPAGNVVGTVTT
jgi:hypothetical protein